MSPAPAFLTQAQAAEYLSFAPRTFRDLSKKYLLPTYGPKRNRFRKEDLEAFMSNPVIFLEESVTIRRPRKAII
ncbi:helix-turn-helix domain-containing protein [Fundidesulfovibrio soli]|uniref:helix-turn-helix domain-containing protein n=1 Tax=Fundidesulfovibrio soli TaxID=2922716 RepID=UPI001FAEB4FC|nr:helix-turn-helix domain-containing protein [Fundidesulfovibrio soli]